MSNKLQIGYQSFKVWLSLIIYVIVYDFSITFFKSIIHTFFRDIKVRGSFNVPKKGPIIFVIAPHHNQFLDGCVVISKVKEYSNRRISFLIAGKSYRRPIIGLLSRLTGAIPVERAQDLLKPCPGKIYLGELDDEIIGEGTKFTKDCSVKGLIGLPSSKGNFQIVEVISDTKLKIKNGYKDKSNEETTKARYELLHNGTSFKLAPHIDNNQLFQNVFDFLNEGKVLGLFPEGGSHDRTDLLPLKPGVAIMALGAAAQCKDPDQAVNIIPLGLNYFHPHRFRSRAVIEFGKPIKITQEHGKKYLADSRNEVDKLLETITLGLKEVTVTCDDYETLITLQAARRLFTSGQREQIPLPLVVEMNRRLIKGYQMNKDKPDVIEMKNMVLDYNKKLMMLGIHDHQVESLTNSNNFSTIVKFSSRLFKVALFFGLSLPGIILFSPVFITARRISKIKQQEALAGSVVKIKAKDVIGTWKVLVALVLAPSLYIFYSICGTVIILKWQLLPFKISKVLIFLYCYAWSVLTTYASLRIGEIGMDYYKSLKPLFLSLVSRDKDQVQIEDIKKTRKFLSEKVTEFCDKYGPNIFNDYEEFYHKYNNIPENEEEEEVVDKHDNTDAASTVSDSDSIMSKFSVNNLADVPIFSNQDLEDQEDQEEAQSKPLLTQKIRAAMRNRMKMD